MGFQSQTPPQTPPQTLMDSLQVISGGAGVHRSDPILQLLGSLKGYGDSLGGAAWPLMNQIVLRSSYANEGRERRATEHEFGHIADFRNAVPKPVEQFIKSIAKNIYANEDEAFADLFALAVEGLQQNNSLNVIQEHLTNPLALREAAPALAVLTGLLLQTDLYKNHPMNKRDE